ncbi:hypothetical protein HNP38_002511 [Chryseobacterium defluvii]|uniref:Uncharacterized protein n=1 Tax=Chryseobacterium defluvii TaxID=160396 RepID=A0A840KGY1_9FLAO|nr:hypothetical protein [Chryseobacterium defluvii]
MHTIQGSLKCCSGQNTRYPFGINQSLEDCSETHQILSHNYYEYSLLPLIIFGWGLYSFIGLLERFLFLRNMFYIKIYDSWSLSVWCEGKTI